MSNRINETVKKAGKDINQSVLMLLKDQLIPIANRKEKSERSKRPANYNMASANAIAFDETEQESKKQKLDEQAVKELSREQKKKLLLRLRKKKIQKKKKKRKNL